MRRVSNWLTALGSCGLLAAGVCAQPPASSPGGEGVQPAGAVSTPADPEMQRLLERLSQLSAYIGQAGQGPQAAAYQMAQCDVLLQLSARSKGEERDRWLRMAVDSNYSAALQNTADETTLQRLKDLPTQIAQAYPDCALASYAALQAIQARYNRAIARAGENPVRYQEHYCTLLLQFAQQYPRSPEAQKAVMDAAQTWESLGKPDEARRCYHYLAETYPGQPAARKAGGAVSRMGLNGERVSLKLPLLYSAGDQHFDLDELHGHLVIVYFWASSCPQAGEDLQVLKQLSDQHRAQGFEVVQVNMDVDPAKGRDYLSGRLTAGSHLFQQGGLDGAVAERYGIGSLPQTFLVGKDGKLIQQARQPSQMEAEVNGNLGIHK